MHVEDVLRFGCRAVTERPLPIHKCSLKIPLLSSALFNRIKNSEIVMLSDLENSGQVRGQFCQYARQSHFTKNGKCLLSSLNFDMLIFFIKLQNALTYIVHF